MSTKIIVNLSGLGSLEVDEAMSLAKEYGQSHVTFIVEPSLLSQVKTKYRKGPLVVDKAPTSNLPVVSLKAFKTKVQELKALVTAYKKLEEANILDSSVETPLPQEAVVTSKTIKRAPARKKVEHKVEVVEEVASPEIASEVTPEPLTGAEAESDGNTAD